MSLAGGRWWSEKCGGERVAGREQHGEERKDRSGGEGEGGLEKLATYPNRPMVTQSRGAQSFAPMAATMPDLGENELALERGGEKSNEEGDGVF